MAADAGRPAYEIFAYDEKDLDSYFANRYVSSEVVTDKRQLAYLKEYLATINARTILVENAYVDRDYLEDFAAYYVRCFTNYERRCKRLHFFKTTFNNQEFQSLISGATSPLTQSKLNEDYLGFIAVKPLPDTVIGRTCLVTHDPTNGKNFSIVRDYDANLFGISLKVRETLAFQEQDRVVAACASSALWSAFHGTCKEFGHHLPSPSEITTSAGAKASDVDRNLPNNGLTWGMMADAIRYVGLEPLYQRPADENDLKAIVYAYLRGGIPAVLGFNIHDEESENDEEWQRQIHAVAVCGYQIDASKVVADKDGFRLCAYKLDRFFVHDDQIGPFAPMVIEVTPLQVMEEGKSVPKLAINTEYLDSDGVAGKVHAIDPVALLPLYHKIRIPYARIHDTVFQFSTVFLPLFDRPEWKDLEWDIYLTTSNEFKGELSTSSQLGFERKHFYLTLPLPRFVWRATALAGGKALLDLLFDATDIEQGNLFSLVVEYDADLANQMPKIFGQDDNKAKLFGNSSTTARHIVDWYIEFHKHD